MSDRAGLDADTVRLRAGETNAGNFFADAMRADVGSDIALMNSGAVRGDRWRAGMTSRECWASWPRSCGRLGRSTARRSR